MTVDLWRYQTFFGVGLIAFFFPLRYWRKTGIAGATLWSYVLVSAAFGFLNPSGTYGNLQIRVDQSSGVAFAIALLGPLFVLSLKPSGVRTLWEAFEVFAVLDSLAVLIIGYGAFNNASMDTAFIAAMIPSLLFRPDRHATFAIRGFGAAFVVWSVLAVVIPLSAVLAGKGATAIFTLAVGLSVFGMLTHRSRAVLVAVLTVAVGLFIQRSGLWNSHGRVGIWKQAMDWWLENANFFYGTGIGTFEWVGLTFQTNPQTVFLFLHNEPLQILFEGGAWGLTLAIVFVWRVLVGAGDRPWLLSTCFALLTLSTTQFPLRFFFSALFCLLVARVSLDNHALEEPWRKS